MYLIHIPQKTVCFISILFIEIILKTIIIFYVITAVTVRNNWIFKGKLNMLNIVEKAYWFLLNVQYLFFYCFQFFRVEWFKTDLSLPFCILYKVNKFILLPSMILHFFLIWINSECIHETNLFCFMFKWVHLDYPYITLHR